MNQRNYNIELFRIVLMFGIVFLHCAYNTVGSFSWQNCIFRWSVDGFALITGYFGVKFSFVKIARLYGLAFLCSLIIAGLSTFFGEGGVSGWIENGWIHLRGCWFLHAYLLLLCLAPMINLATDKGCTEWKVVLPFVVVVLSWGLLCELPVVGKIIPHTNGVGSFSGLTLAAVYVVGRLYRRLGWASCLSWSRVAIVLPCCLGLSVAGVKHGGTWVGGWFSNYASPVSVVLAVVALWVFQQIRIPVCLPRVVVWVAASMFPVYIYHGHPWVFNWMQSCGLGVASMSMIVFLLAILVDIPRRLIGVVLWRW